MSDSRNEWLLVSFTATTNIADAATKVALPMLAVRVTSSPLLITAVATMLTLPWLVTALHVGVLVDRVNRRHLMLGAETARMAAIGVLLVAFLLDQVTLPMILVVAFVLGVAAVVALVTAASMVPSAVPRRRWQTATARITAAEHLCNGFLGAPVGGFLVAVGFAFALGVTGLVYVAGIMLLVPLAGNFTPAAGPRRPARAEIREGLDFLWQHRLLRTMALLIAVMAACWSAWLAMIPGYAVAGPLGLDASRYGLLLTCLGAGGVTGTVLVGPLNRWLGRRWSMFADIVGTALLVAVPAMVPPGTPGAVAIGVAAFAAGVGGTMWTVNSRVITQSLVPNEMLGRFNAASRLVMWGTAPVAAALAGLLAQLFGYRAAFGFFAVGCVLVVLPFLRVVTERSVDELAADRGE